MKVLVTAGSTLAMMDQVRGISNIFHGVTGTMIAQHLAARHQVTLLTSNMLLARHAADLCADVGKNIQHVMGYKEFGDLAVAMSREIQEGDYDAIIHSAAVSDYRVVSAGIIDADGNRVYIDMSRKIASSHKRMFLELEQTPKIIDAIRSEWGFRGYLVKFKLEVGISDDELLTIARRSRATSQADLIVANCLEWARKYAYVLGEDNIPEKVGRTDIADAIERRMICTLH